MPDDAEDADSAIDVVSARASVILSCGLQLSVVQFPIRAFSLPIRFSFWMDMGGPPPHCPKANTTLPPPASVRTPTCSCANAAAATHRVSCITSLQHLGLSAGKWPHLSCHERRKYVFLSQLACILQKPTHSRGPMYSAPHLHHVIGPFPADRPPAQQNTSCRMTRWVHTGCTACSCQSRAVDVRQG